MILAFQMWISEPRGHPRKTMPVILLQERGPLPGPETGLLFNTQK